MEREKLFDTYNAGYAQALYEEYLRNPELVDESWRRIFAGGELAEAGLIPLVRPVVQANGGAPSVEHLHAARAAGELIDSYRLNGHWAARLNPLGGDPPGHPMLEPSFHGIEERELETIPASAVGLGQDGRSVSGVLQSLREAYTGTIGYEFEHMEDPARRAWLRDQIESGRYRQPLSVDERKRLLKRLSEVEAFEQFLHKAYLGQKRFSLEGTDMMVPMLDLAIERAAAAGAREVVLGMAHRGRLNVLTHVLGRPYTAILAEFEKQHAGIGTTGDVKYHMGAEGTYATVSGVPLNVTLAPNPSHLEFVNPVVEGMARARQEDRSGRELTRDENLVLPILIHGDAAFAGQGTVSETMNLAQIEGYRTGGTLHLIANNQVGFTTEPNEARSTYYSSDLALGFDLPVFHVNADDPEACLAVVRLALAYRERFHGDVVIDLVGYRRYGHNEGDEPAYTQPQMYHAIEQHPRVRQLFGEWLVAQGVLAEDEVASVYDAAYQRLVESQAEVRAGKSKGLRRDEEARDEAAPPNPVDTAVDAERLLSFDRQLHTWPEGFTLNPKLGRQLERRGKQLPAGGVMDWAHAEALAFASLLADGRPIRLTGQDTERGTFSQRHLVLHDVNTGAEYTPLAHLEEAKAPFQVYNSPLSEQGCMGFEYGYSVATPDSLVAWEAQFGDFANGAQVIIDQFIAAGRAKWGQLSGLVLLLPHGYEGQGPEHSSARLERFLQLAAEDNMRVANCTTPAQYFHLLRWHALAPERRPLVVMTPKSLLRHPKAVSHLDDLSGARFETVLDDDLAADRRDEVKRLLFCTGKVYYDLTASEHRESKRDVAVARVALLYPFPEARVAEVLASYPALEEVVWVQEEPQNMGAWTYMEPRLRAVLGESGVRLAYIGRPERASPAEGFLSVHEEQQARLVETAFTASVAAPRKPRKAERRRR